VPWLDWFRKLLRPSEPIAPRPTGHETTIDSPGLSSLSLATGGYELRVGVVSTRGNVRESNEDNFYVPGLSSRDRAENGSSSPGVTIPSSAEMPGLFIVADGMGGQLAGEKASEMAVGIVPQRMERLLDAEEAEDDRTSTKRAIRDAVAEANKEILAQSHLVPEYLNMGTTIVLALFRGHRAYIAGIGDSRAYRLREGRFERLTKDHSLAMALEEAGTIRPEETENHRFRNVLYLYLGCKDAREGPDDVRILDLARGDRFLLATDGLTGVVRDDAVAEVLAACDDPQRAAQALVNRALENRSKDNITCIVIKVV
jgi:serine/threonine protein phosphatase PrpC